MLEIKNVSKHWTSFALKDIDLEIGNNEYFVLLGPTGAGKTLLLETIAGFHRPDKGRIIFEAVVNELAKHVLLLKEAKVEDLVLKPKVLYV